MPKTNKEVVSLSHTDLDGIGCQIVLYRTFKQIRRFNCSYGKIQEYLDILESYVERNCTNTVFITDLSFEKEDYYKLLNIVDRHPLVKFIYIDHHPYNFELTSKPNLVVVHSIKASATKLTFLYCNKNYKKLQEDKKEEDYFNYINAYDIWLKDTKEFKVGLVYNELFWKYKQDVFYNTFKDSLKLRNKDKEFYKNEMIKKKKLFDKLEKTQRILSIKNKILLVFVDDFRSWVTIDYPKYKAYIIISSYGGISIRLNNDFISKEEAFTSKNNIINQIVNLDTVISSGGHDYAFGVTTNDSSPSNLIKLAKNILEITEHYIKD